MTPPRDPAALVQRLRQAETDLQAVIDAWKTVWNAPTFVSQQTALIELIRAAADAIVALTQERDLARAALRQVEWVDSNTFAGKRCPWCRSMEKYGHAPDCARQAALGEGDARPRTSTTLAGTGMSVTLSPFGGRDV